VGRIKDANKTLSSAIKISVHEIRRTDPVLRIAIVEEVEDARVLKETSQY
jgi:hypothetical protein